MLKEKLLTLYEEYFDRLFKTEEAANNLEFDKVKKYEEELVVITSLIKDLRNGKDVNLSYFIKEEKL